MLRWERRDNRVLVRSVSYATVADSANPIYQAVRSSNFEPILAAFNVEAYGPDSAPVVEVTRLFTAPPPEIGPGAGFPGNPDPTRSFVERAVSFPENLDDRGDPHDPGCRTRRRRRAVFPGPATSQSVTMNWSMVKLPDRPMMPRLFDKRVGYFSLQNLDYSRPEQRAQARQYVVRWRLEKKDPERRDLGAGEADHVLRGSGDADVARAVREAGDRGLAAGVRGGRVPSRHRRRRSADAGAGSRLVAGRRALLGGALAAVDDRERAGA